MFRLAIVSILTIASALAADPPEPSSSTFAATCETVSDVATRYLTDHGITVTPGQSRDFFLHGVKIRDGKGHRILFTNDGLKRYSTAEMKLFVPPLGFVTYSGFALSGILRLIPTGGGCRAELRHSYSAYGILFQGPMPVDGDPVAFSTNHQLETEYLAGIGRELKKSRP